MARPAALQSPVYKFVKQWGIALPLHAEFRTLPNLFYVPPLLPTMGKVGDQLYDTTTESFWGGIERSRLPLQYLASLFAAGDTARVEQVLKKMMAVKVHRRQVTVGDLPDAEVTRALAEAGVDSCTADAIFRLTTLALNEERFVIPAAHREEAAELIEATDDRKGSAGFGLREKPARGL